jgi:hypothetical protein
MEEHIMFARMLVTCLAGIAVFATTAKAQTTWYVDDDAPNDPGPGDPTVSDPNETGSPEHPFDAIQEGIDAAIDSDTVLVLNGAYTGHGNRNLRFVGRLITVRSENGPLTCVINCERSGRGFYFYSGETHISTVEGFTITNGLGSYGGGIYCSQSSPTISNCIISGNEADWDGGGVYCRLGNPTISNCKISRNVSYFYGGGILCRDGNPTITNCTMTRNSSGCG